MNIRQIDQEQDLLSCDNFYITHLLWGTNRVPLTYGKIALLKEDSLLLQLTCMEGNPLRTYQNAQDPVYEDSAMEAFFEFYPNHVRTGLYLNFEINANGAMLAMYGKTRNERTLLSPEQLEVCPVHVSIQKNHWTVDLRIPISLVEEIYQASFDVKALSFACNFYKISGEADKEHYASYAPVLSDVPNFHMPECFESCTIIS